MTVLDELADEIVAINFFNDKVSKILELRLNNEAGKLIKKHALIKQRSETFIC